MHKITSVIPTYNNLPFLKLTVTSVRQNCYYNDMPIFIFAENCTDGTNEWLASAAGDLGIEYYIENETYIPVDLDWKNLNEIVIKMLDNQDKLSYIVDNNRKVYDELYSAHNFCKYWYDFFANLSGVDSE